MVMLFFLVGILAAAAAVFVWLWLRLKKEGLAAQELAAVPVGAFLQDQHELVVNALKDELAEAQAKLAAEERVAAEAMTVLRASNDQMQARVAELEAALLAGSAEQEKSDHLRAENFALRNQFDDVSFRLTKLKEHLVTLEQENAGLRAAADSTTDAAALVEKAKQEYQGQLDAFFKQIEELRADNVRLCDQAASGLAAEQFRLSAEELAAKVRELEAVGAAQAEKDQYLQYELTKSRAQVVGLERLVEGRDGVAGESRVAG